MIFILIPFISSGFCINESIYSGRSQYSIDTISNISFCFFTRINSSALNGGVLYFATNVGSLYMSNSGFYNVGSSGAGGAFHLSLENVNISFCCANSCFAASYHYGYIQVTKTICFEYQSVSYCSKSTIGAISLMIHYGYTFINNFNCSMNSASRLSGMDTFQPSGYKCSLSTFAHNNVSEYSCLGFNRNMAEITKTNIIDNVSPERGIFYLRNGANLTIEESIFNQNQNTLLYILVSGIITVRNTFINHDFPNIGSGTLINVSFTLIPSFQIEFFSTKFCFSGPEASQTSSIHNHYKSISYRIPIFQIIIIGS